MNHGMRWWAAVAAVGAGAGLGMGARADVFLGLGGLPGDYGSTQALCISDNGQVVYGAAWGFSSSQAGFRWTLAGGMSLVQTPPRAYDVLVRRTNVDGSVAIGHYIHPSQMRHVMWRPDGSPLELSGLTHGVTGLTAVSSDGRTIVGHEGTFAGDIFSIWRDGATTPEEVANPQGYDGTTPNGISPDGRVVVGTVRVPGSGATRPFRWTLAEGYTVLTSGLTTAHPVDASYDGSIVVGTTATATPRGFIWSSTGTTLLALAAGYSGTEVGAVSWDGRTIVGDVWRASGTAAAYWRQGRVTLLADALAAQGIDLTGWQLQGISGVSSDGNVMCGYGMHDGHFEAFVAMIPSPSSLLVLAGLPAAMRRRR